MSEEPAVAAGESDQVETAQVETAQVETAQPASGATPAVPELAPTGVPAVDAAIDRLSELGTAPLDQHVEIFDDVQRQLHEALAELDDEP